MNNIDLTSSRVFKGSMKFTPKIGKKDKKSKKNTKNSISSNKKIVKKSVSTKNQTKELEKTSNNITINLDTNNVENNLNNDKITNKSITVNTIKNKNTITTPAKENNNDLSVGTMTKSKGVQVKPSNKKVTSNVSKTVNYSINKNLDKPNKFKQSILEDEEDTISEVSDDYLKLNGSIELKDSIEDSNSENEVQSTLIKKAVADNEETLVEETDNSNKELSSETADDTLIVEDSQRILETDEEEIEKISKKEDDTKQNEDDINDDVKELIKIILSDDVDKPKNNKNTKDMQSIKKFITGLMDENEDDSEVPDKKRDKENSESIYELLDKEEFNQSIDTEVYNKPINHEDDEIENMVKEKVTTKRKAGRPKKTKGQKLTKKNPNVIVISDDENNDESDSIEHEPIDNTTVKKEIGDELPVKVKQENAKVQSGLRISQKRLSSEDDSDEDSEEEENLLSRLKRQRISKKVVNNSDDDNNDHGEMNNENETRMYEKSKNVKSIKAKITRNPKSLKTTQTESESEHSENGDATPKRKTVTKKRKASSPSKKSTKRKKINNNNSNSEDDHQQRSSDGEDSDNVSISSRTIADIIDNYRGTEISTTQKEIYRLAALKRKATLERKRGKSSTPEIMTQTVPEKPKEETIEKKPKVYDPEKNKTAIQMRVVNGEIVIDQQSTLIDHIDTTDEALPMLKYDENNHITSASFKPKLKPLKWTKDETELFYKCLSIFGTNFSMLAIMFPSRNRKQLLNKYKNEEKINPGHVQYALKHKKALDPEFFEKYSGQNMMEIGRDAVEKVKLIEEQRKKEDLELFSKKKENDNDIKRVIIKSEQLYGNDVKEVKPILAN